MPDSNIIKPAEKIAGKLITLEKNAATFKEAERRFAVIDATREHLLPWMEWATQDKTKTAEDTYNFLKSCEAEWEKGTKFDYGVFENSTGEYVGGIGVFKVSFENKSAERGSWLAKHARGKGYAQEASALLEAECDRMGFQRIHTKVDAENIASIKNMEKSGYILEGVLRNKKWCGITKSFRDMRIYAKVKGR
ncbi:MAG: GNAT family N-acetyltransferase [Alphaproteobacteria bacterium]|nr:GNAT family N-acetyltransferase [Alphaproteobacteria bacterium]